MNELLNNVRGALTLDIPTFVRFRDSKDVFRRGVTILVLVALFSLVTPAGFLLGNAITENLTDFGVAIFTALAAGTFLFVCLCELLPEVFHHREDGITKILLLCGGIAAMALMHEVGA